MYLLKAIETGSDFVLLVTCKLGDCKYIQGNLRAPKRILSVDDLLIEAGLGKDHVKCVHLDGKNNLDILLKEIDTIRTYREQIV